MSSVSASTTNQLGNLYEENFIDGFWEKNQSVCTLVTQHSNIYQGNSKSQLIGDVDVIFRIRSKTSLRSLLPYPKCSCEDMEFPEGTTLVFEFTSMSGEDVDSLQTRKKKGTKVDKKIRFFETLIADDANRLRQIDRAIDPSTCVFVFVYNGNNYFDLREKFNGRDFKYCVVNLPIDICIKWKITEVAAKAAKEAEEKLAEQKATIIALQKQLMKSNTKSSEPRTKLAKKRKIKGSEEK